MKTARRTAAALLALCLIFVSGCSSDLEATLENMTAFSESLSGVEEAIGIDPEEAHGIVRDNEATPPEEQSESQAPLPSFEPRASQAKITGYTPGTYADIAGEAALLAVTGGISYAVISGGEVVFSGGAGVQEGQEPAGKDTVYALGGVSRLYTAAAVLLMAQKSELALDANVSAYLPEFKMRDERYANITMRQLLSGASGLPGFTARNAVSLGMPYQNYTSEFLSYLATEYLQCAPGMYTAGAPDGFTLAQLAAERVSGKPLMDYLRTNLLDAEGFTRTGTAQSLQGEGFAVLTREDYAAPAAYGNAGGALGVYASAEELARFGYILACGSALTPEAHSEMTADYSERAFDPADAERGNAAGLGWDSVKALPFQAMGIKALRISDYDGLATLIALPELGVSVAVASNTCETGDIALSLALAAALEKGEKHAVYTVEPMEKQSLDAALRAFEGLYCSDDGMTQVKLTDEGELWTLSLRAGAWVGGHPRKYAYVGNGRFSDGTSELYFKDVGNVTYLCARRRDSAAEGAYEKAIAQKLEGTGELSGAWAARNGKAYLALGNSSWSRVAVPAVRLYATSDMGGCVMAGGLPLLPVTDNTAAMFLNLPGASGGQSTLYFYTDEEGRELARFKGGDYISAADVPALRMSSETQDKLSGENATEWFTLPERSKQYVSYWGNARYIILDPELNVLYDSLEDGECEFVRTPKGGYIAVMGKNRAEYRIAVRLMSLNECELPAGPDSEEEEEYL